MGGGIRNEWREGYRGNGSRRLGDRHKTCKIRVDIFIGSCLYLFPLINDMGLTQKPNYHGSLLYTQVVLPSELSTLAGSEFNKAQAQGFKSNSHSPFESRSSMIMSALTHPTGASCGTMKNRSTGYAVWLRRDMNVVTF